jgi:hypothetical protein
LDAVSIPYGLRPRDLFKALQHDVAPALPKRLPERQAEPAGAVEKLPVPRIHEFDGVFATTKEEGGRRHLFNQLLFLRFAKGWNTRRPDWFSLDCSSDRAIPKGLLQSAPHGD